MRRVQTHVEDHQTIRRGGATTVASLGMLMGYSIALLQLGMSPEVTLMISAAVCAMAVETIRRISPSCAVPTPTGPPTAAVERGSSGISGHPAEQVSASQSTHGAR